MAVLREERDPSWWRAIAEHPDVAPHIGLGSAVDLTAALGHPGVVPLAGEHGGFLLFRLDPLGRCYELHTLFRPEGWGREVLTAAKAMFGEMFARCDVIVTHEHEGWWRSRPPKSFGFKPAGDFTPAFGTRLRTWTLTKVAWEDSPAWRRSDRCRILH